MKVVSIGECLLELGTPAPNNDQARMSVSGDTINTSIYLARLGTKVDFLSAVGDDPHSDWMIKSWQQEGVGTSHCLRIKDKMPGMVTKGSTSLGFSHAFQWRPRNILQHLFSHRGVFELLEQLYNFDVIYLTGITLSVFQEEQRDRLFQLLERLRLDGKKVVFDGNFRQGQWSNINEAKRVFTEMAGHTDIALPTFNDEAALFGDQSSTHTIDRLANLGIKEIVVKQGLSGCLLFDNNRLQTVENEQPITVVDTTATGDAFNAGYIHTRFRNKSALDCISAGQKLAKEVVQQEGNLIAIEDMPSINGPKLVIVNKKG